MAIVSAALAIFGVGSVCVSFVFLVHNVLRLL